MLNSLIVVTDLDGTLLDHHSYLFKPALPALQKLRDLCIPVILNSSKTAREMMVIREELNNHEPFIVENGAGIFVPEGEDNLAEIGFGMNRADILQVINALRQDKKYQFTGFSDMKPGQLEDLAGLTPVQAERALERHYTEPLLWRDTQENFSEFCSELARRNMSCVKGGRFVHVSSPVDKAKALEWLRDYYGRKMPARPRIIALGDGENDRSMLEQSDYPVLVRSPVNEAPHITHRELIRTQKTGPEGWNEAILGLVDLLGPKTGFETDR